MGTRIFVFVMSVLLTPGVMIAEEPDSSETTSWVPVPVTPGDGRSYMGATFRIVAL